MPQTLQFGHSILLILPNLHSGQHQRPDTLCGHVESSMPYVVLRGQVMQGAGWVPDPMRMRVEHYLRASCPECSATVASEE